VSLLLCFVNNRLLGSLRYTKRVISELLQNKVDMSQLVITKALAKDSE